MIQRIQTIWLLIAAAAGITSIKTSFFIGFRNKPLNDVIAATDYITVTASYNLLLTVFTIAAATVSIIAIFLFKNRKSQIRMVFVALILSLLVLVLYYWQSKSFIPQQTNLTITAIIPIAIPITLLLAIRGIWKDEKLVRSTDRLR